jgi:hypothetical protein
MMKNTFKFIGIIALTALIGFSMLSCEDAVGTVRVQSKSSWYDLDVIFKTVGVDEIEDSTVLVELLEGKKVIRSAQAAYDQWVEFSDAPANAALGIRVTGTAKKTDGSFVVNELSPLTPTFSLTSGQTKSFKYDGLMWLTEIK